jgi:hypothetical protein
MRRLTFSCLMLLGPVALAQNPDAPQPPPEAPPPQPPPEAIPPPPPPSFAPPPMAPPVEPLVRVRAGANGAPAVFAPGISYGANFSGRIGVQIRHLLGVYADVGGGFGLGGSISAGTGGGGVSINVADYWRFSVMGELDLGRYFFFSLGVGVCGCTWGGVSEIATAMGASQAAYVADGYFPELIARVGLGFGRTRHKFTVALEDMAVFGKMTQVSQNASMAGAEQSVSIGHLAVGNAPAIVFGWDMR